MMGFHDRSWRGLLRPLIALSLLLATCAPLAAQNSAILPNAKTQFFNALGQPLAGGSVYTYLPTCSASVCTNTGTLKTTWSDPLAQTPNSDPIVLDSAGTAFIFGQGNYWETVFDSSSNLIWQGFTAAPPISVGNTAGTTAVGCANCGISASAVSSNITFTLTDQLGNTLSSTDQATPCFSVDLATQTTVVCTAISSALSITLNSGSNLGVSGTTQPFRVWLALFYNAGTPSLGLITATNYTTATPSVISLNGLSTANTTACASCASATSAQTWYTPSSLTASPYVLLGYAEFSAFTVNGHWVLPSALHSCYWGCKKPGDVVQTVAKAQTLNDNAGTSSTTFVVFATATASITPTSAANGIFVTANANLFAENVGASASVGVCSIVRGTVASSTYVGVAAMNNPLETTGTIESYVPTGSMGGLDFPATTSAQAYTLQRLSGDGAHVALCPAQPSNPGANVYWLLQEIQG
jgi:hypothetical protein